jgi:Polyketide cyclase / dehydrase and lipid transport
MKRDEGEAMWSFEGEHTTSALPEDVFAVWADVANWPTWDASLAATTLDGAFAAGTHGTLHPEGAPEPLAFQITSVDEGVGFADETHLGPTALRFIHRAESIGDTTRITLRVEVEGPDEAEIGEMVTSDLAEGLAGLAAAAEHRRVS